MTAHKIQAASSHETPDDGHNCGNPNWTGKSPNRQIVDPLSVVEKRILVFRSARGDTPQRASSVLANPTARSVAQGARSTSRIRSRKYSGSNAQRREKDTPRASEKGFWCVFSTAWKNARLMMVRGRFVLRLWARGKGPNEGPKKVPKQQKSAPRVAPAIRGALFDPCRILFEPRSLFGIFPTPSRHLGQKQNKHGITWFEKGQTGSKSAPRVEGAIRGAVPDGFGPF